MADLDESQSRSELSGTDVISIKNLQLPFGVLAPDIWGKPKEQPALVTVTLLLRGGFGSAAARDALDNSTIHYGQLAKRIRASCAANQTAGHVSANAEAIIADMAQKPDGRFVVARSVIDVILPKASMSGDSLTLVSMMTYDERGRTDSVVRTFSVQNVRVMTLIGVNSYERSGKQPVMASLQVHLGIETTAMDSTQTKALLNLEHTLVQIMEDTSFETLESLANFTVAQLQKTALRGMPGSQVQLRLEKPRALPFAECPAVEVLRLMPGSKGAIRPATATSSNERPSTGMTVDSNAPSKHVKLNVIKPYIG